VKSVYLAYSWEFFESREVKRIKEFLRKKFKVIDPYEIKIGTSSEVAELNFRLIDSCDVFALYLPPKWESIELGIELCWAFIRRKKIIVFGEFEDKPFLNLIRRKGSVEFMEI